MVDKMRMEWTDPVGDVIGISLTDGLHFPVHSQFRFPLQHDPPLSLVVMRRNLPRAFGGEKNSLHPLSLK